MKNLTLLQRLAMREDFLKKKFNQIGNVSHTSASMGRVLEEYEDAISLEEEKEEKQVSYSYFLVTLQYKDIIDYHSIKVEEGMLPHTVVHSSELIKLGTVVINTLRLSKEEFLGSPIYLAIPPDMLVRRENTESKKLKEGEH